jgi:hypothetical protein
MEKHRNFLRTLFLRYWRRRIYLEAMHWLKTVGCVTYSQNVEPLQDALERAMQANWWQSINGSRLLFWRWPPCWRRDARNGAIAFHKSYSPPVLRPVLHLSLNLIIYFNCACTKLIQTHKGRNRP